jgi:hypothetical protein
VPRTRRADTETRSSLRPHASCKVRFLAHKAGDRSAETYELLGSYHHDLVRTADGWRTRHLHMEVALELGEPGVLSPSVLFARRARRRTCQTHVLRRER